MADDFDYFFGDQKPPSQPQQVKLNLGQRLNNPGNLRDPNTGKFREFTSAEEGWRELRTDLQSKIVGRTRTGLGPMSTIEQFSAAYAPKDDPRNDPKTYAKKLATQLGVTPDTPIGRLGDKVDRFARAVADNEGWFARGARSEPASPKAKTSEYSYFFGDEKPAAKPERPPEVRKPEQPKSFWTTPMLFRHLIGESASEFYNLTLDELNSRLPENMRGNWAVKFTEELSKSIPAIADFATSPAGLALIALHNPITLPIAAGIDVGLGMQQAAQVGVAGVRAYKEGNLSPERAAEMLSGTVGAVLGMKGGAKAWERSAPALRATPLEELRNIQQAARAAESPAKKIDVLKQAVPQTRGERIRAAIYSKPGIRDIASILYVPKPKLAEVSADLVRDRVATLKVNKFESDYEAFQLRKLAPEEDLKIDKMGYVIQGDAPATTLSPGAREAVKSYREYQRKQADKLRTVYGDKIPLQDAGEYLSQQWDMPELARQIRERTGQTHFSTEDAQRIAGRTLMRDPHLRQRKIPGYKFGMEAGIEYNGETYKLKPLFDNIVDVMKSRDSFLGQAIANQRFANTLTDMGVLLSESDHNRMALGWPKAIEATALAKAAYAGKLPTGETIWGKQPVRVHPDFEMAINSAFAQPYRGWFAMTSEAVRALGKKTALTFSTFHPQALTEQALALYTTRAPHKIPRQIAFLNPEYWRGARNGLWEVAGKRGPSDPPVMKFDPETTKLWLRRGLNLSSQDSEAAALKALSEWGENFGKSGKSATMPVRLAAKGVAKASHIFDRALWDFYFTDQLMNASETIMASEIKKIGPNATPIQIEELGRSVADHVNNAFGAINFEQLMVHPRMRTALNWMMMAPAWTTSNLRTPLQVFESQAGTRLASKWALGAALSWFATTQVLNYALSGWYNMPDKDGKRGAHWSWDNPGAPLRIAGQRIEGLTENAPNVQAGYMRDPETGAETTERYIVTGKGFRESMGWFSDPWQMAAKKMSIPIREGFVLFSGHEPTGYEVFDPQKVSLLRRISTLTGLFLPFGLRDIQQTLEHKLDPKEFKAPAGTTSPIGLPTTRGITVSRAAAAYGMAKDEGAEDVANEVLRAAVLNNIDPKKVIRAYGAAKAQERRQIRGPRIQEAPPPARGSDYDYFFGGR